MTLRNKLGSSLSFIHPPGISFRPIKHAPVFLQIAKTGNFAKIDRTEEKGDPYISTKVRVEQLTLEIKKLQELNLNRGKVIDESKETISKLEFQLQEQRINFQTRIKDLQLRNESYIEARLLEAQKLSSLTNPVLQFQSSANLELISKQMNDLKARNFQLENEIRDLRLENRQAQSQILKGPTQVPERTFQHRPMEEDNVQNMKLNEEVRDLRAKYKVLEKKYTILKKEYLNLHDSRRLKSQNDDDDSSSVNNVELSSVLSKLKISQQNNREMKQKLEEANSRNNKDQSTIERLTLLLQKKETQLAGVMSKLKLSQQLNQNTILFNH